MNKVILFAFALASSGMIAFAADRRMAFERNQIIWIAKAAATGPTNCSATARQPPSPEAIASPPTSAGVRRDQ
jgi:hypothetical protein